jgi:hypothetical protein
VFSVMTERLNMSARLVFAEFSTRSGKRDTHGGEIPSAAADMCIICACLRGTG